MRNSVQRNDLVAKECARILGKRLGIEVRLDASPPAEHDADCRVTIETHPPTCLLGIVKQYQRLVREQVRHAILAAEVMRRRHKKPVLFMAPWIEGTWADELRNANVFYADLQGNVFLRIEKPQIELDVCGKRPEARIKAFPGRLIEVSGLKVLYNLLTRPDALQRTYRRLAADAGVAVGTVGVVMREMRVAGHLREVGRKEWKLGNRTALVDLFVRGYALKLRPACLVGRYRHQERDVARLRDGLTGRLQGTGYALTGGTAAGQMTGYLQPDGVTLFADEAGLTALREEHMLPDPAGGQVTVLRRFWPGEEPPPTQGGGPALADPLLVYAELLHDGRPRELETAQLIRDQVVGNHG